MDPIQASRRMLRPVRAVADRADGLVRSGGAHVDRVARSVRTARLVSSVEARVARSRRERKLGKGTLRRTHVVAYRGYAAQGRAHVRVRVVEEPPVPSAARGLPYAEIVQANLRRFVALALPGVRLRIRVAGAVVDVVSDRHGYATAVLPVPDASPGWLPYACTTRPDDPDEEPVEAAGEILVPDLDAAVLVVSDIDDTVLRTGLTEGWVAVRRTLVRDARTRRPVPGMPALYRGLERGGDAGSAGGFFYLSTGPWNLYDLLVEFFQLQGVPLGSLLLTDWGPNERYVMRSGREHKRGALRRLLQAYPDARFVLVGDSGQGDPEVYAEVAEDHPDRVAAIVLLDVGPHLADRAAELLEEQQRWQEAGVAFHLVPDAAEAARVLAGLGLVAPGVVDEVSSSMDSTGDQPETGTDGE